jgi:hypothetical protein
MLGRMLRASLFLACSLAAAGCTVGAIDDDRRPPSADAGPGGAGDPEPGTGPDAAPGQATAREILEDFGACMRFEDWEAQGLGGIALVQSSSGPCYGCHANGTGSNYLTQSSLETFERIRTFPYIQRYAKVDGGLALVVSNDLVVKGQQVGHPSFVLPAALELGIGRFFELTHERSLGGDCAAP